MKISRFLLILLFAFVTESATMQLTSPHFTHQSVIPQKYTCKGESINHILASAKLMGTYEIH